MREGLEETLTVANVKLDPWLARTLSTTNPLEFINGRIVRHATTSRDRMAAR
jgi:hypothetical protein